MEKRQMRINISEEEMLSRALPIAAWEALKKDNMDFQNIHLKEGKVIKIKGSLKINGNVIKCMWNYEGICLNVKTLLIIEEGCM